LLVLAAGVLIVAAALAVTRPMDDRRFVTMLAGIGAATGLLGAARGRKAEGTWPALIVALLTALPMMSMRPVGGVGFGPDPWPLAAAAIVACIAPAVASHNPAYGLASAMVKAVAFVPAALYVAQPQLAAANLLQLTNPMSAVLATVVAAGVEAAFLPRRLADVASWRAAALGLVSSGLLVWAADRLLVASGAL